MLIRSAEALETAHKLDVLVLDKTGTLTKGHPELTDIVTVDGVDQIELLRLVAAAETRSEHPLAQAIVAAARDRAGVATDPDRFDSITGKGVVASVAGRRILVGNARLLEDAGIDPAPLTDAAANLAADGKTRCSSPSTMRPPVSWLSPTPSKTTLSPASPRCVASGCRW